MMYHGRRSKLTLEPSLDFLMSSLGEQYDEYKRINERLSVLSANSQAGKLGKPILYSIERAVVPSYKARGTEGSASSCFAHYCPNPSSDTQHLQPQQPN